MIKIYIPPLKFKFLTPFYDLFCRLSGFGKKFRNRIISNTPLRAGTKLLDVGCGTGVDDRYIKQKYPSIDITGIDPDAEAILIARENSKNLNIHYVKAYASHLPFRDKSFDIAISTLVFHHLTTENKQKALKEIYRVLKLQGTLILTDLGKPKNKHSILLSWISYLEEGKDNAEGKIPIFIKEAGFKNIKIIDEPRKNVYTIKATK